MLAPPPQGGGMPGCKGLWGCMALGGLLSGLGSAGIFGFACCILHIEVGTGTVDYQQDFGDAELRPAITTWPASRSQFLCQVCPASLVYKS